METVAISLKDAEEFLAKHGRHYVEPAENEKICAIAVGEFADMAYPAETEETEPIMNLHGVAILGRTPEGDGILAHIYVNGVSQGYSLLYGACWRALKALGYKRAVL